MPIEFAAIGFLYVCYLELGIRAIAANIGEVERMARKILKGHGRLVGGGIDCAVFYELRERNEAIKPHHLDDLPAKPKISRT